MSNNHGSCKHCGFDFNGEMIYDYFLREYEGDEQRALDAAKLYGATKETGRFGLQVYVTEYSKDFSSKEKYFICPECRGKQ